MSFLLLIWCWLLLWGLIKCLGRLWFLRWTRGCLIDSSYYMNYFWDRSIKLWICADAVTAHNGPAPMKSFSYYRLSSSTLSYCSVDAYRFPLSIIFQFIVIFTLPALSYFSLYTDKYIYHLVSLSFSKYHFLYWVFQEFLFQLLHWSFGFFDFLLFLLFLPI